MHLFAGGLPAAALLGAAVLVAVRRGRGLTALLVPRATSASMLVLGAAASRSAGVQLAWLDRPPLMASLYSLYDAEGGPLATWLVLVFAAVAVVLRRREPLVWVLAAWGAAAPAFLMVYSLLLSPVQVTNYVMGSMLPLAVLAALGLAALPRPEAGRMPDAGPAVLGLGLAALVLAAGGPFRVSGRTGRRCPGSCRVRRTARASWRCRRPHGR